MEELTKLVAQKAGISEDQARLAVTTTLDFIKAKLPPALAGQVDGLLASGQASAALGNLGGLLGKK